MLFNLGRHELLLVFIVFLFVAGVPIFSWLLARRRSRMRRRAMQKQTGQQRSS